ncbi:MAG: cytochrome c3 family protein, partial [Planctomycetota bacterium]
MSQHTQGHVRLKDADDAGIVYDYDTATPNDLESFCINCHDADGAANGPGTQPFSDGATVPDVKGTPGGLWADSSHKLAARRCPDCHTTNAHGSANIKLLQAPTVDALCYNCHTEGMVQNDALANNRPGGYVSADDIQEAFAKSVKHDLGTTFSYGGNDYTLQCSTCHNPHIVSGKYWDAAAGVTPVTRADFSDPVNNPRAMGTTLWGDDQGEKMSDFAAQGAGTGGWGYSTARGGTISWDQPAVYQPPKSGNGYDFEFGGDILPDYTTLCLDCHSHRMSAANPPVNWGQGIACTDNSVDPPNQRVECGADHGLGAAGRPQAKNCPQAADDGQFHTCEAWGSSGNPDMVFQMNYVTRGRGDTHFMRWPYESAERNAGINFVLSCTDCHEAHGANRGGMVRERFNVNANGDCGTGGDPDPNGENCTDGGNWNSMCNACHYYYGAQHAGMSCGNASCHEANSIHRIIHTTDSGASTRLQLTSNGWEGSYEKPGFTPEIASVDGHIGSDEL